MKKLKVFVGLNGRWVLCEKFPKDEEYEGLHDALEDLINENIELEEKMGFYLMSFSIDSGFESCSPDYSDVDSFCLNIEDLERC